jgi:hypothetical protein
MRYFFNLLYSKFKIIYYIQNKCRDKILIIFFIAVIVSVFPNFLLLYTHNVCHWESVFSLLSHLLHVVIPSLPAVRDRQLLSLSILVQLVWTAGCMLKIPSLKVCHSCCRTQWSYIWCSFCATLYWCHFRYMLPCANTIQWRDSSLPVLFWSF